SPLSELRKMPTLPHLRCQAPGFVCSSCFSPFKSITVESADSCRFFALYYIKTDKMPSCSHREDFVVDFSAEWTLNWIQRGLGTHFCGRRLGEQSARFLQYQTQMPAAAASALQRTRT